MKKILFLLLVTISSYAQTYQNPTFGTVKSMTAPTVSTTPTLGTIEANGTISKIVPNNVPITYTPINYAPSSTSIADQLAGIDTRLGQIGNVTAGVTTRVHLTGDNITVTAGTFFASNTTGKGATAAGTPQQTLSNNDDQKQYFTKDVMSAAVSALTTAPPGVYSGQLTVTSDPTPGTSKQRFTIEIYKCNNGGTPIASGITGAPVGNLGVTVVAILDSGLINVVASALTNIGLQGNLASTLTLNTGERLRYHVSAEKVGTDGGSVTMNVYYGTNYNSYYDIPVTFKTSTVINDSGVTGVTASDALNNLKTGQDSKLNKTYVSNYDVADNTSTISSSTFDAFGILVQSLSNKIFMFYREGTGHVTNDGKIVMRTSTDGGKTFSSRTIVHDQSGVDCRNIAGGVTPTGRIILFFLKVTSGVFTSQGTMYSDDDGVTWSTYTVQTTPVSNTGASPYGNMIAIADGKLAIPYYATFAGSVASTYLKFSSDNGVTWGGDVVVGSAVTNGYNEATYAYLDGSVILGVSRKEGSNQRLRQFISTDNGQTWTDQGDIAYPKGTNIAPWLNTYIESNGEKYASLFFTSKDITPRTLVAISASKTSVIAGVSGWLSETERIILSTPPSSDYGYTTVINPRQSKKMLGMYFTAATLDPTTTANYTFFNYVPSAVVPAMTGTTNYLQKKTGSASLTDSQVFDNGTSVGIGTASPSASYKLQVEGAVGATIISSSQNGSGTNRASIFRALSTSRAFDIAIFENSLSAPFSGFDGGYISARTSGMPIYVTTNNGGTEAKRVAFFATGGVSIGNTTDPGATNLSVTGNVIAANLLSGTYTPTFTAITNVTSVVIQSGNVASYTRVGNIVSVSVPFTITPTATGNTVFRLTYPIAKATGLVTSSGNASIVSSSPIAYFPGLASTNTTTLLEVQYSASNTSVSAGVVNFIYDITK